MRTEQIIYDNLLNMMETTPYTKIKVSDFVKCAGISRSSGGADKDSITAGTTFVNDLNGDSMKRAIFSAEVEELTGIEITQAKLRVMETVGDLYAELGDWLA